MGIEGTKRKKILKFENSDLVGLAHPLFIDYLMDEVLSCRLQAVNKARELVLPADTD